MNITAKDKAIGAVAGNVSQTSIERQSTVNIASVHFHHPPTTITGLDAVSSLYSAPKIYKDFVERKELKEEITKWMSEDSAPQGKKNKLLVISGQGSAGKTSLAVTAAEYSKNFGFEKCLWIEPDHVEWDDQQMKEKSAEVTRILKEGKKEKRRMLIIDDVQSDKVIRQFQEVEFLVVTTRNSKIGEGSNFKMTEVTVEGLNDDQIGGILEKVLSEGKFKDLKKVDGLPKVLELCKQSYNFPLLVHLMSIRLEEDHCEWEQSGEDLDTYLHEMKTQFEGSKAKLDETSASLGRIAYTGYKFNNVHAAIFDSIERLEKVKGNAEILKEAKKKYQYLTVLKRGENINPITMGVIWGFDGGKARELMKEFSKRGLVTDMNFHEKQRQFVMHDLVFDVVQEWTKEKKKELTSDVIRRYENASIQGNVNEKDKTFYTHFLSWCLLADELNAAVSMVCNLRHLSNAVSFGFKTGIFQDLKKLSEKEPAAAPWRDIVRDCPSIKEGDKKTALDLLIRIALLRPHEESTYKEAKEMVEAGEFPDRFVMSRGISK